MVGRRKYKNNEGYWFDQKSRRWKKISEHRSSGETNSKDDFTTVKAPIAESISQLFQKYGGFDSPKFRSRVTELLSPTQSEDTEIHFGKIDVEELATKTNPTGTHFIVEQKSFRESHRIGYDKQVVEEFYYRGFFIDENGNATRYAPIMEHSWSNYSKYDGFGSRCKYNDMANNITDIVHELMFQNDSGLIDDSDFEQAIADSGRFQLTYKTPILLGSVVEFYIRDNETGLTCAVTASKEGYDPYDDSDEASDFMHIIPVVEHHGSVRRFEKSGDTNLNFTSPKMDKVMEGISNGGGWIIPRVVEKLNYGRDEGDQLEIIEVTPDDHVEGNPVELGNGGINTTTSGDKGFGRKYNYGYIVGDPSTGEYIAIQQTGNSYDLDDPTLDNDLKVLKRNGSWTGNPDKVWRVNLTETVDKIDYRQDEDAPSEYLLKVNEKDL